MKIVFRTDASLLIGSGHVMRCLTLAAALRAEGADCHFVSRAHPGHLLDFIARQGFAVTALPAAALDGQATDAGPGHAAWLGCTWHSDAQQSAAVLAAIKPDWLVLDHYALDQHWESALRSDYRRLLVIDDLADRPHRCDLLLDQNLGRSARDYAQLAPACEVLAGPGYALLRPEFAALRADSLGRRAQPALKQLLITMGGVDQPNATGQVLEALQACGLPADCRISVVMGAQAPWLGQVRAQAAAMPWPTEVLVGIGDMARRMADSDLAIGAAGGTAWERCCLGLPTLMVVLAANQWPGAQALQAARGAELIGEAGDIRERLPTVMGALAQADALAGLSRNASRICDGQGAARLVARMRAGA